MDNQNFNLYGYNLDQLYKISSDYNNTSVLIYDKSAAYSKQVSISVLHDYIVDEVVKSINLGSMAYCDKEMFATSAHIHTIYTSAYYIPAIAEKNGNANIIDVWTQDLKDKYSWNIAGAYAPSAVQQVVQNIETADIGTIKFITTSSDIQPEDPHSSNFDGWVFPGQTITCGTNQFKKACLVFAGSEAATSFTVPALTDFIKLCVDPTQTDTCRHVDFCRQLPYHTHTGSFSIKCSTSDADNHNQKLFMSPGCTYKKNTPDNKNQTNTRTCLPSALKNSMSHWHCPDTQQLRSGATEGSYIYNRGGDHSNQTLSQNVGCNFWLNIQAKLQDITDITQNISISTGSAENTAVRTHPSFNYIPALVYIGLP